MFTDRARTVELLESLFGENAVVRDVLGLEQAAVRLETDFAECRQLA